MYPNANIWMIGMAAIPKLQNQFALTVALTQATHLEVHSRLWSESPLVFLSSPSKHRQSDLLPPDYTL